jgi:hypothetical protein
MRKAGWLVFAFGLFGPARAEPIQREPVTLAELPPDAQDAIRSEVKRHKIISLAKETAGQCSIGYNAQFHKLTSGRVEVAVSPDGAVIGRWTRLDEPSGDGP